MAEFATLARPYAEAIFRLAKTGDRARWIERMSELAQIGAHPDVLAMIDDPKVDRSQVVDTLLALMKTPVDDALRTFLTMLVENDRVGVLPEIASQFNTLLKEDAGTDDVVIESAFEMTRAQVQTLLSELEKKFGRKLVPQVKVESALIGGVRVTVGDEVLDTSVRAGLDAMQQALTA